MANGGMNHQSAAGQVIQTQDGLVYQSLQTMAQGQPQTIQIQGLGGGVIQLPLSALQNSLTTGNTGTISLPQAANSQGGIIMVR